MGNLSHAGNYSPNEQRASLRTGQPCLFPPDNFSPALYGEEDLFIIQAAAETTQISLGVDYAVTGDKNRDGIAPVSLAHCPRRPGIADSYSYILVTGGLAIRDLLQLLPNRHHERSSGRTQGQVKFLYPALQVQFQLAKCFPEQRRIGCFPGGMLLASRT